MVLPQSLRRFILSELHYSTAGAHFGIPKKLFKIKDLFFWYTLKSAVENWCADCEVCGSRKLSQWKGKARTTQYNVGLPMERIAFNFISPFPRKNTGQTVLRNI